jgi:hypothetical protein
MKYFRTQILTVEFLVVLLLSRFKITTEFNIFIDYISSLFLSSRDIRNPNQRREKSCVERCYCSVVGYLEKYIKGKFENTLQLFYYMRRYAHWTSGC